MTFPSLDRAQLESTRDALHAYGKLLGNWLKHCRPKRKHWWHASLRPSLGGLTTGVVHGPVPFELELDLRASQLRGRTASGAELSEQLHGQTAAQLADTIAAFLMSAGLEQNQLPLAPDGGSFNYRPDQARAIGEALCAIGGALAELRARIPEETSPIQVWPHHFDLSMLWLPGEKIPGQDPSNEEYSDKQMNFGFVFGDEGIADPYLYVTAYPTPGAMAAAQLPAGTTWRTEGFSGAVLLYETLVNTDDPHAYLLELWSTLLQVGREHMLEQRT